MLDMGQQPTTIPVSAWMPHQRNPLATAQRRKVRMAFGSLPAPLECELMHAGLPGVGRKDHLGATPNKSVPVTNDQTVTAPAVLEVIAKPFLCAQSLEKLQIRFLVLRAEIPRRVIAGQLETPMLTHNAMLFEHLGEDVRHRTVTEHSLAGPQGQARQFRPQADSTKPGGGTMSGLDELMQLPVNTVPRWPEMQKCRPVQQACQVQCRIIDQHIHVDLKGLADRFSAGKGQDLKGIGQTLYIQTK
ncbi:hypothetical protein D3C85_1177450 [compost metagenome]